MNSNDYKNYLARLEEIERKVKDPETGQDDLEGLLEEAKTIVKNCYRYTRGLLDKIEELESITPESVLDEQEP